MSIDAQLYTVGSEKLWETDVELSSRELDAEAD